MKRDVLEPNRYEYLSKEHSDLYDRALAGEFTAEEANRIITELLIRIQQASMYAHSMSRH